LLLKLSQATTGKFYKVEEMIALQALAKRLAVLGMNTGVLIQLLSLYKHGAVVKTNCGEIAIGADLLDSIMVTVV
jgi:Fe2+ transport system protein FeoA